MSLWFLDNPQRLTQERKAIEQLERSAEWLIGTTWSLNAGLCLDAVIQAHGYDYLVRMSYPEFFPFVPPIVRPINAQGRWTAHQYGGTDGPLCLEWGPDNWRPDITGAQMLESTYRLLHIENPLGNNKPLQTIPAPSRERLSLGQETRSSSFRFYAGGQLISYLKRLPEKGSGTCRFTLHPLHSRKRSWRALIHEMQLTGGTGGWIDDSIPKTLRGPDDNLLTPGVFFKTDLDPILLDKVDGLQALQTLLHQAEIGTGILNQTRGCRDQTPEISEHPLGVLCIDRNSAPHLFFVFGDGGTLKFSLVQSEVETQTSRTPECYRELANKTVGIVGMGSVGSKIALTLARSGVGRMYLIDHDLYFSAAIPGRV